MRIPIALTLIALAGLTATEPRAETAREGAETARDAIAAIIRPVIAPYVRGAGALGAAEDLQEAIADLVEAIMTGEDGYTIDAVNVARKELALVYAMPAYGIDDVDDVISAIRSSDGADPNVVDAARALTAAFEANDAAAASAAYAAHVLTAGLAAILLASIAATPPP